eukprot:TRINITY_DN55948_c0_g1_i1.p1 TRINITY_DN55948_c0_g1~~TRINITY_DN55948_c0_g1_i1.p1  ORF type:complete len:356 (+),score=106.63 TRINITY_DN55948_c0_g1_i1:103-1068(+)
MNWTRSPVSKSICCGVAVATGLGRFPRPVPWDSASPLLVALPWCFADWRQLALGCLVIYLCRHLERLWGSRTFAAYCGISWAGGWAAHALLWFATRWPSLRHLRPGPLTLLAALAGRYWTDLPRQASVGPLSDKWALVPVLAWYMWDPHTPFSWSAQQYLPQVLCGLLGGALATTEWLPLWKWKAPACLCNNLAQLLGTNPPPERPPRDAIAQADGAQQYSEQLLPTFHDIRQGQWAAGQRFFGGGQQQQQGQGGQGLRHRGGAAAAAGPAAGAAAAAGSVQVSDENVARLMEIGVTREQAVAALQRHDNNADTAAASLFG